jgi:hypothetical protein
LTTPQTYGGSGRSGARDRRGLAITAALDDQQDDQHHLGDLVSDADRVVLTLDQGEVRDDRRGRQRDQGPAGETPEPGGRRGRSQRLSEAVEAEQRRGAGAAAPPPRRCLI